MKQTHYLPKLCGADVELGNFIVGRNRPDGTGYEASRALLREIPGIARTSSYNVIESASPSAGGVLVQPDSPAIGTGAGWNSSWGNGRNNGWSGGWGASWSAVANPQDSERKFLPSNGGCAYIDLNYLELCIPEVLSAREHVACWHAMLSIAARALEDANQKLEDEAQIQLLANNSDGLGNSYGSHLNFLVTRTAWDNLFCRKLHHLAYLASYLVSSIIFTGQGKVASENGAPEVSYQLSQRGDFFETLTGPQTTWNRPLVNSRDEPLCGQPGTPRREPSEMARLHVIFFDSTLCHVASFLKVGVLQAILSMLEGGWINPDLILDDPLEALQTWGHDPSLRRKARTVAGRWLTAVELQLLFLEQAHRFGQRRGWEGRVSDGSEILDVWEDTLTKLQRRDLDHLTGSLDWVLKQALLERAIQQHSELDWESPQVKHLDHLYSNLNPEDGLFWACEQSDVIQRMVSREMIDRFTHNPPEDTRAWTRAMLLRLAGSTCVDDIDWDFIRFKLRREFPRSATLNMDNPLAGTKSQAEAVWDTSSTLEDALERLGVLEAERYPLLTD